MSGGRAVKIITNHIKSIIKKKFELIEPSIGTPMSTIKRAIDQFEKKLQNAAKMKNTIVEKIPGIYVSVI